MQNRLQGWYRLNPVIGGILLCILMVVTFRHYFILALVPPSNLISVDHVTFSPSASNTNRSTQQRTLSDDWLEASPNVNEGWYSAKINLDTIPDTLWAIYLPVVQMNAKIYLNNSLVGQIGDFDHDNPTNDPFVQEATQPHYVTLPTDLLTEKVIDLKIHAKALNGSGLLGKIYLGEDKVLRPIFNKRFSLLVTAKQAITAGMAAIAVLMSVLWILRKQDYVYAWYALMLYTWSAYNFFSMGINLPLSQHVQNMLSLLALGWFVVFMVKATHHYLGQEFPMREKVILGSALTGSFAIIFSDSLPWSFLLTHQVWSTFALNLAGYALLDFTVKYRDRHDLHNPLILPAGFSMLVFGLHDWLLIMGLVPRDDGRLMHFSAPVAVAVFGILLLERFARFLKQAENLNIELEQRVTEKHQQLEENYQRLKKMENKQLLIEERERFMKDIHDGVGGHLISILSMVRSGKQDPDLIVSSVQTTLEDLRLMVDSLSPQEHDISSLLGSMRTRIEPQLESSGLKLKWQINALPEVPDIGPQKALQVMRVVQEAITNVIRHAKAKNIVIRAFTEGDHDLTRVVIEINDDGCGMTPEDKPGHGIANMKHRANEIGAKLSIVNAENGTKIRLLFPPNG